MIFHIGYPKTATTYLQKEIFNKTSVISNEHIIGNPIRPQYERDIKIHGLKELYPDAKIIIGIRDKDKWLKSCYSQYVKNGGFHSFKYWSRIMVDKRYLDYEYIIGLLQTLFGFDNVLVYRTENLKKDIERIKKFIHRTDIQTSNKRYNKSLNSIEILLFRMLYFIIDGYKYVTKKY